MERSYVAFLNKPRKNRDNFKPHKITSFLSEVLTAFEGSSLLLGYIIAYSKNRVNRKKRNADIRRRFFFPFDSERRGGAIVIYQLSGQLRRYRSPLTVQASKREKAARGFPSDSCHIRKPEAGFRVSIPTASPSCGGASDIAPPRFFLKKRKNYNDYITIRK